VARMRPTMAWMQLTSVVVSTCCASTQGGDVVGGSSSSMPHACHQVDVRVLLALHGWEGRHVEEAKARHYDREHKGLTKGEGGIVHCVKVNFCVTKMSKFKFRNKFRNLRKKKGTEARAPIETGMEWLGINKYS
jgi:hypothetical protein